MHDDKQKLGLPLEYQQLPEFFDAHNINEQTTAKNSLIETLLKAQQVKTVLDMTCGTGSQVFYLAERGYDVIGSDFSPALIAQAKKKAQALNLTITFMDGDMRTVKAGKFDAVITIFNAIGHLTKADFETALKNICDNLHSHGVYIFDIFNLQAISDQVIDDFKMDIKDDVNGVKIHNIQYSEIDRVNGLLTSHDCYTISKDNSESVMHKNTFSLQIYTASELKKILERNGLDVIQQYDMDGHLFEPEKSLSILTVARKR